MSKHLFLRALCVMIAVLLVNGCKRSGDNSAGANQPEGTSGVAGDYFQTSFQDESQFIVETIAADLTEQMYYARHHELPDAKQFAVHALEKPGSPFGAPVYQFKISMAPQQSDFQFELNVNGPIWSPGLYQGLASALAKNVGLSEAKPGGEPDDTVLLSKLTDGAARTIEGENQKLSEALETNYDEPVLHEKAAVLLGAFALREHSGYFYDVRLPLCQMTAHLTLARFLAGGKPAGINGQMAEVMLFTLMNNRASALERLDHINVADASVTNWARVLRARLTGDYRPLARLTGPAMIEKIAWFLAFSQSASPDKAWLRVTNLSESVPDFSRIAQEEGYSVETAHDLLRLSVPLELNEMAAVYGQSHSNKLNLNALDSDFNELPEHGFSLMKGQPAHVRIIGWGQWAMFLQRHLCNSVMHGFNIYERKWGLPEDARKFAARADTLFGGLRLYPFVQIADCLDAAEYHKSLDEAARVTKSAPDLIPGHCWNNLWSRVPFAETYEPVPYDRLAEWFKHDPPPGTAYDPRARMQHGHLLERQDAAQQLARLHELAPWDRDIASAIMEEEYKGRATYAQAVALLGPVLQYDSGALEAVADTVRDQPELFTNWMTKAAALDPAYYFTLGEYVLNRGQEDEAAEYYENGQAVETDSLISASYASWRIKYYLKKGRIQMAQNVADAAGDVYSAAGLEAKAEFFEATGKYAAAFEWYAKDEERYDDAGPLIGFCYRYKAKTGDARFDAELKSRLLKVFPTGIANVSLKDFQSAPVDGVVIREENDLLRKAGLKSGDVIVAINGIRVHDFAQYRCGRNFRQEPEMSLIAWHDKHYCEIKASPPNHLFGVDMGDYTGK